MLYDLLVAFDSNIPKKMNIFQKIQYKIGSMLTRTLEVLNAELSPIKREFNKIKHSTGGFQFHLNFITLMVYHNLGIDVKEGFIGLSKAFPENPLYQVGSLLSGEYGNSEVVRKELKEYPRSVERTMDNVKYLTNYIWQRLPEKWNKTHYTHPETKKCVGGTDYRFLYQLFNEYRQRGLK